MRRQWRERIERLEQRSFEIESALVDLREGIEIRIRALDNVGEVNLQELRQDLRELRRTLDHVLVNQGAPEAAGLKSLLEQETPDDEVDPEAQKEIEEDWTQLAKAFEGLYGERLSHG